MSLCLRLAAGMAVTAVGAIVAAELPGDPSFWHRLEALPPTPKGTGYPADLKPGQFVQFRFSVPDTRPVAYLVTLDNIVALHGRGTAYQVEIHLDAADGPLVHRGPRFSDGNAFNAEDLSRLDLTDRLTERHLAQGFVDVFATAWVEGDTWTSYRDDDGTGRDLFALVPDPDAFARWQAQQQARAALAERGVLLLPQPQQIELRPADFGLGPELTIALLGSTAAPDRRTAEQLAAELTARTGHQPSVVGEPRASQVRLTLATDKAALATAAGFAPNVDIGSQGYVLDVRADGVVVAAYSSVGLFYGAQTLGQLLGRSAGGAVIRGVRIVDWPALPNRMMQYDLARGNTVNVEYWKHWIRELSRLKVNQLMLYMEDDYRFEKHPYLGRADTFTAAKAQELVAYAREYWVELVPQLESLGHADALLSHPELKDLRLAHSTWAICPLAERALPLLDDLYAELAAAFPQSPLFHVGGDEVWGFAADGRCAAMVREKGEEGVYAFHLNNLQALLAKRGRAMAFWGDEVLNHPKVSDSLTREAVVFDWHYGDQPAYPSIRFFQEHGFKRIYVCPAVHGYFDVYPQYRLAFRNIAGFTRAGIAQGVEGVCCTTWGMNRGGNAENYLYGLAYAAQCAWNPGEADRACFDPRFAAAWLGVADAKDTAADMDAAFWFAWRGPEKAPFWQRLFEVSQSLFAAPEDVLSRRSPEELVRLATEAGALAGLCDEASAAIGRLRIRSTRNGITLDALQLAVNLHRFVAGKLMAMTRLHTGYRAAYVAAPRRPEALETALEAGFQALQAQRAEFATLEAGFRESVATRCGDPQDLVLLLAARARLDAYLGRLAQVRGDAAVGKPWPNPAALALGARTELLAGQWRTPDVNPSSPDQPRRLVFEVTEHIRAAGTLEVEWDYTAGPDGLDVLSTGLFSSASPERIPADLQPVAVDEHHAFTGAADRDNRYRLVVPQLPSDPTRRLFLVGTVYNQRTFDTQGNVWLRQGWDD